MHPRCFMTCKLPKPSTFSTNQSASFWQPSHLNHHLKSEDSSKDIIQILENLQKQSVRQYPVRWLVKRSSDRCFQFKTLWKCVSVCVCEWTRDAQHVPLPCQRSHALSALHSPALTHIAWTPTQEHTYTWINNMHTHNLTSDSLHAPD